jgi:integrase
MASVRKRKWTTKDGVQTAFQTDYFDADGKRHRRNFEYKRDADTWLARTIVEVEEGTHTPDSATTTLAEACQLWLKRAITEGLEKSSRLQYQQHVNLHICPERGGFQVNQRPFGEIKLSRLTKVMVEGFRDHLMEQNSRALARKILVSFKSVIREAQRKGLVARNIAEDVKIAEDSRDDRSAGDPGIDFPNRSEVQKLLANALDRWWRAYLVTGVFTGLRPSELRGLPWDHVDFDKRVIRVRQRANLWCTLGRPKSKGSRREIPMDDFVADTLREWQEHCPRKDGKLWLVFPNGAGNVESHANIMNRRLYPAQMKTETTRPKMIDGTPVMKPKYGLHGLRHFFASVIIEQGFSPKRVMALMGHSSIQITFDTYGHLFKWSEDDHTKFAAGRAWVMAAE